MAGAGDEAVDWDTVVREQTPQLRRVIGKRVPMAAVDDIVQETFLRAFRSRHSLDANRPIGPWLATIAIRVATDTRRRDSKLMPVDAEYETAADAATELAGLQRVELVRRALDSLSTRHRHLLELVALDGVRQVTIAEHEGVAPEVIRSAVLRARQRFRVVHDRLMQEHGLLGAAGSLQSALARVRLRMVRIEPWVPGKAELAAAVLAGLLMSAPVHNTTDGRAENRLGVVEAVLRPVRLSGPEARAGGSLATGGQAVRLRTKLPGGSVEGDIELDGLEVPNTYWTANIAGLTMTVGTNGQHGRFVAGYTAPAPDVSSTTSMEVEVRCQPENVTARTKCTVLDLAEQQARSLD